MNYTQLTREQRYQISALLKMGHNRTEIAGVIGTHKSTVSRELGRNKGLRGYRPKQADHLAQSRRNHTRKRISAETWKLIETKLRFNWSPEQISGWLNRHHAIPVSHEWIYQYILADKQAGGNLYRHLRCQKKRRKRYGSYDRRGQIPKRCEH
jgi:IS30 family transposase